MRSGRGGGGGGGDFLLFRLWFWVLPA